MTVFGEATLTELRQGLRGTLLARDDPGYEEARRVWNGDIDRHPALVVRCAGTADVIVALRFARGAGLPVAVRGGGHNVAGFGTIDDGIVLDLSPMRGIRVDPRTRTARAEAGVLWGELDRETQAFGLATTGGMVTTTGIAGFTLGGGIGWLMRAHGLTVDNLVGADLVTADGQLVHAESEPGLLWALRGGGGNFGVVTSFEYTLHPVGPIVYGGALFHPADRAGELLRFYRDWVATTPDELTTLVAVLTAPPEPFVPPDLVGTPMIAVACCHTGPEEDAAAALKPLRDFATPAIDLLGQVPYVVLQGMFDNSAPRGNHSYWKTEYLDALTDAAVDTIVEHCAELPGLSPFSTVHLHHLGGAVAEANPSSAAFAHRRHQFVLNIIGQWTAAEARQPHVDWVGTTWQSLRAHTAKAPYLNFLGAEGPDRVRAAYGAETYQRLADLKRRYDPENTFRHNQNIPPA